MGKVTEASPTSVIGSFPGVQSAVLISHFCLAHAIPRVWVAVVAHDGYPSIIGACFSAPRPAGLGRCDVY